MSKAAGAAPTEPRTSRTSGKGGGNNGKSKDPGSLAWNLQLLWDQESGTPIASTAASSAQQTETRTTVGTIECAGLALDLCGTTTARQGNADVIASRWIAVSVDTGAGGTVWPMNAGYAFEKVAGPEGPNYKTAAGEMVEGQGRF